MASCLWQQEYLTIKFVDGQWVDTSGRSVFIKLNGDGWSAVVTGDVTLDIAYGRSIAHGHYHITFEGETGVIKSIGRPMNKASGDTAYHPVTGISIPKQHPMSRILHIKD